MVCLISGINHLAILLEAFQMTVPFVSFDRPKDFRRKRTIDNRADFSQARCLTSGQELNSDIPQSRRLSWAGKHSSAGGIRRELIEELVFGSSTNHSDLLEPLAA